MTTPEQTIISTEHAYMDALAGGDITSLQREVIDSGSPKFALAFARDVPGADVAALHRSVVESGDVDVLVAFDAEVDGAPKVTEIPDAIASIGDADQVARFLTAFPEVDAEDAHRTVASFF